MWFCALCETVLVVVLSPACNSMIVVLPHECDSHDTVLLSPGCDGHDWWCSLSAIVMTLVLYPECDSHDWCSSAGVTVMAVVLFPLCAFMAVLLSPVDCSHVCGIAWCCPLSSTVLSVVFPLVSPSLLCCFSPSVVVMTGIVTWM